jgi:hypothetical protein
VDTTFSVDVHPLGWSSENVLRLYREAAWNVVTQIQGRGRGDSLIVENRGLEILRKQPFSGLVWKGERALLVQSGLIIGPSIRHHTTHHNLNKIY